MRLATNIPNVVSDTAVRNSIRITCTTTTGVRLTPTSGASTSMIVPWTVAMLAPPAALPTTIADRLTGATSISRRNPNSRSQTIDMAEKIAIVTTLIATMPG
jgi:hypothetical protein